MLAIASPMRLAKGSVRARAASAAPTMARRPMKIVCSDIDLRKGYISKDDEAKLPQVDTPLGRVTPPKSDLPQTDVPLSVGGGGVIGGTPKDPLLKEDLVKGDVGDPQRQFEMSRGGGGGGSGRAGSGGGGGGSGRSPGGSSGSGGGSSWVTNPWTWVALAIGATVVLPALQNIYSNRGAVGERVKEAGEKTKAEGEHLKGKGKKAVHAAEQKLKDAKHTAQYKADTASDKAQLEAKKAGSKSERGWHDAQTNAKQGFGQAKHDAKGLGHKILGKAEDLKDDVANAASSAKDRVTGVFSGDKNDAKKIAAYSVVGTTVGAAVLAGIYLAIPKDKKERLGKSIKENRDRARDNLSHAARDARGAMKRVVGEGKAAGQEAKQEARGAANDASNAASNATK